MLRIEWRFWTLFDGKLMRRQDLEIVEVILAGVQEPGCSFNINISPVTPIALQYLSLIQSFCVPESGMLRLNHDWRA